MVFNLTNLISAGIAAIAGSSSLWTTPKSAERGSWASEVAISWDRTVFNFASYSRTSFCLRNTFLDAKKVVGSRTLRSKLALFSYGAKA
jgi:hypothetical protein